MTNGTLVNSAGTGSIGSAISLTPQLTTPPILAQFDALEKALYSVREQMNALEQQMSVALVARAPEPACASQGQPVPECSPIASRLQHLTSVAMGLNADLSSIRQRLEL